MADGQQAPSSSRWSLTLIVCRIWWALIAHLLMCLAIALCMTLLLDKYKALDNATGKPWELGTSRFRLRVSEVTTIISAALVVVRTLVSSWTTVTLWRCALILMESTEDITLSQLTRMMDFRAPFWPATRVGWVVVIVVLLLLPQALVSPLVTGAVGWSTSSQLVQTEYVDVDFTGHSGDSLDLDFARMYSDQSYIQSHLTPEEIERLDWTMLVVAPDKYMKALPVKGVGLASTMWAAAGESGGGSVKDEKHTRAVCRQRVAYDSDPIPANSIVYGSDLPCISIENIRWQRPSEAIQNMTQYPSAKSNFSIFGTALLEYRTAGSAILFDPLQPTLQQMYLQPNDTAHEGGELLPPISFPDPEIFSRSLSLLILLDFSQNCSVEALEGTTIYGSITTILPQESIWNSSEACYAHATVDVTAGVVNFKEAAFITSYTLQSNGSSSHNLSRADFKPETWVGPAMVLLPDVMGLVSIANTSQIPTWNNLPGYVETLIIQSYLASWGVLRPFQDSQPTLIVSAAEPRLIASVNMFRVWGWFIINMFVPLSGLILYFGTHAHWETEHDVIHDPVKTLLGYSPNAPGGGDRRDAQNREPYDPSSSQKGMTG